MRHDRPAPGGAALSFSSVAARLAILLCLTALSAGVPATALAAPSEAGRLLVTFETGASRTDRGDAHAEAGAAVDARIRPLDVDVVEVAPGEEREALLSYRDHPAVASAQRDPLVQAFDLCAAAARCPRPNDPRLARQWGLENDELTQHRSTVFRLDADIDAPSAWLTSRGTPDTVIAVLDTGIDQDHPDLASQIRANVNFTRSASVDDLHGHGSHAAGIAAAAGDNGEGIAGVAFGASLMNVKVLDDSGTGSCSRAAEGIVWAVNNGARVLNLSFGGPAGCDAQARAVRYASERGVLLAAAAGNEGTEDPSYPGRYDEVVAVAASDRSDALASFSNRGSWVDVAAPGVGILSTLPNHAAAYSVRDYGYMSGTSMASPTVAGAAGVLWSVTRDEDGDGKVADEVRARIESFADPIARTGARVTFGRLNLCNAVAANRTACAPAPAL